MDSKDVATFMKLAGQVSAREMTLADADTRKLGARLLLSEVLEYVVVGLGVTPIWNGSPITAPDDLEYENSSNEPNPLEMVDGLADTAYTMYWNALAFGIPLEEAFNRVCKNNLEKFVELKEGSFSEGLLTNSDWNCGQNIEWPSDVAVVEVITYDKKLYAVGRDKNGKVRKPSSYKSVDLSDLAA